MLPTSVAERRNAIIEILNEKGRVSVKELSALFSVSSVIIRTDLDELEKQDMLTRVHGGAITSYKSYYDMGIVQRSNTNAGEKEAIAEAKRIAEEEEERKRQELEERKNTPGYCRLCGAPDAEYIPFEEMYMCRDCYYDSKY